MKGCAFTALVFTRNKRLDCRGVQIFGAPVPKNGIPAQVECLFGASFSRAVECVWSVDGCSDFAIFEAKLQVCLGFTTSYQLLSRAIQASKQALFPNRLVTGVLGHACLGTCVFSTNKLACLKSFTCTCNRGIIRKSLAIFKVRRKPQGETSTKSVASCTCRSCLEACICFWRDVALGR